MMNQDETSYLPLRVTNVGPKGKRTFDRHAKRLLIEACLQPGASISGLALKAGINANQLHKWIRDSQRAEANEPIREEAATLEAFVPVVALEGIVDSAAKCDPTKQLVQDAQARLSAQLPNGVTLELECSGRDAGMVRAMIETLRGARCSG
jgi:transposase